MLPDYLHSAEADHFAFIRVPKILLQNEAFQGISVEAKLLYSLLFDRTELSNKNGWRDDQDRVYSQNNTSGSVKTASLEMSESHSNKTNNKKTYFNDTDPSFLLFQERNVYLLS